MSLLLPVHEDMPIVLSLGGQETREAGEWRGGVLGSAFWGLRSVNLSSWYGMSYGLSLQLRKDFRGDGTAVMLGLQVDCEGLALPFILAGNFFR